MFTTPIIEVSPLDMKRVKDYYRSKDVNILNYISNSNIVEANLVISRLSVTELKPFIESYLRDIKHTTTFTIRVVASDKNIKVVEYHTPYVRRNLAKEEEFRIRTANLKKRGNRNE